MFYNNNCNIELRNVSKNDLFLFAGLVRLSQPHIRRIPMKALGKVSILTKANSTFINDFGPVGNDLGPRP